MVQHPLGSARDSDTRADTHSGNSFLADLKINHGPPALLGRFFLAAENAVRERGVTLSFSTLEHGTTLHQIEVKNWAAFPPMLDTRLANIPEDMSYCLLGRNARGQVVCCQGGRIYDIKGRSLADIVNDQSFVYGECGQPKDGQPACTISAPSAAAITGRLVYSVALWVHPDLRGKRLAGILPRISRAYALARWNTAYTIAFVSNRIVNSPLLKMYGYNNVEPSVHIENLGPDHFDGCLLWMNSDELAADLVDFMETGLAEIDGVVTDRRAQDEGLSVGPEDRDGHAGVAQAGRSYERK